MLTDRIKEPLFLTVRYVFRSVRTSLKKRVFIRRNQERNHRFSLFKMVYRILSVLVLLTVQSLAKFSDKG